jgi:hypothetical protein
MCLIEIFIFAIPVITPEKRSQFSEKRLEICFQIGDANHSTEHFLVKVE